MQAVLLFPSFAEGFGLPPMEAALRSCPIVASNCGALPELLHGEYMEVDPAIRPLHRLGLMRQLHQRGPFAEGLVSASVGDHAYGAH